MAGLDHDVVIAGGGPTGLMLAAELALAGVDALVVERRLTQDLDESRAGGLLSRTIEVLDQRGVAQRFLDAGISYPMQGFAGTMLPLDGVPSRHACTLGLYQSRFEPMLADWVYGELGAVVRRGVEVVGLDQDDHGVDVHLSDGSSLRAGYLVGCDGGRSRVRKAAGIDFPGLDASTSWMIAEVDLAEQPELGFRRDETGQHAIGQRVPEDPVRLVIVEPEPGRTEAPTLDELRAAMVRVWGTDFGLRSAAWISWFTDASRLAASYRSGRVLLAGDAAHVHPPQGGQGMGTGIQDAVNLGWKLAQVVRGTSPDALLDTYHQERHPVGARVQENTKAQVLLTSPAPRAEATLALVQDLLQAEEARRRVIGMLSGLDIAYDLGGDHPLVGRRMPDLDLTGVDGATRVFELLHEARPLLLDLTGGDADGPDLSAWGDRIRSVSARTDGPWELPVLGPVEAPAAVLVRPDGHVAWVGELGDPTLVDAVTTWFGPGAD